MQFLEERGQADDAAKPTDPLDQHHELVVLFRELVVDLLECRVHHDGTRMPCCRGQVAMSGRAILVENVTSIDVFTLGLNDNLPVGEGKRLVGMISEADFLKQFAGSDA